MKSPGRILLWAAFSSVAVPTALQAVAVAPELIQNEGTNAQGILYGVILLVLVIGIALGIWIQKKLNRS